MKFNLNFFLNIDTYLHTLRRTRCDFVSANDGGSELPGKRFPVTRMLTQLRVVGHRTAVAPGRSPGGCVGLGRG